MKQHRGTLRGRLTLVYGTLFLVAGLVTLLLTWALVQQQLVIMTSGSNMIPDGIPPTIPPPGSLSFPDGQFLQPSDPIVKLLNTVRTDALRSLITQGAIAVVLVGGLTSWIGWVVGGHMLRPPAGSPRHPMPPAGFTTASDSLTLLRRSWSLPTRSTGCWPDSTQASTDNDASLPMPHTNCEPH